MPQYTVQIFCDECGMPHPGFISINLPIDKGGAIGDIYDGIDLDPTVASLINNAYRCPNTGKMFTQRDNHQVFLVKVAE